MRFQMKRDGQPKNAPLGVRCARAGCVAGFALLVLAGWMSVQSSAQSPSSGTIALATIPPSATTTLPVAAPAPVELSAEQQIALDRARLLQLANDLKAEVDKSTADMLSVSVIRKAAEIQRLAHDLKERMKQSNGEN
jgi:uncharacterized protein (DUF1501 family)